MTIAEIHGKISQTGSNLSDRMEDLLTSDVFTACKYLNPKTLLVPIIQSSINLIGNSINLPEENIRKVSYKFWPGLARSEPDVLVTIEFEDSGKFYVMIEAKYMSGKSSGPISNEDIEIANSPLDQLAREYHDLMDYGSSGVIQNKVLIYLTAHYGLPEIDINETVGELDHFSVYDFKKDIYWTSWRIISEILRKEILCSSYEKEIIKDLRELLERKGLFHFNGFRKGKEVAKVNTSIYENIPLLKEFDWTLNNIEKIYTGLYSSS